MILRDGHCFIALRDLSLHQGGCWEFPGGKCEVGELPENALKRELLEECGIAVEESESLEVIEHDYGDKRVCLHFFRVMNFSGEPHGREGQTVKWVPISELGEYQFPAANRPIVELLLQS